MEDREKRYLIFCQIGARVVASLSIDGELTIYHDNFSDNEGFEVERFIKAFDKWHIKRTIHHTSKKGLNSGTFEKINAMQLENPGKYLF